MYFVDDKGNIYTKYRNKKLKYTLDKDGYLKVRLWNKETKKYKNYSVHRLVASNFIENPNNKKTVNHLNGIKTDNSVTNLEWATYSEQAVHSFKVLGKRAWNEKKVKCIEDKTIFASLAEAGRAYCCPTANIVRAIKKGYKCNGKHFVYVI